MKHPKVFISHSTKTDQNLSLLNKVCDGLEQKDDNIGFDVLVDRRKIQPGDPWHKCINEWMYECDAVVVLLSDAAMQSSWVQAEATVMSVRQRNESNFRLIVVPLENVTDKTVEEHPVFGQFARLHDLQFLKDWKDALNDEQELIGKLTRSLQDICPQTSPFETLVTQIRETLGEIDEGVLETALNQFQCGVRPTPWPKRCRVDMLARAIFREPRHALYNFRLLLEELAHVIDRRKAETLLDILKGIWVQAEAAANLVEASKRNEPVAINCTELENFTEKCYARRAWPFPVQPQFISAGASRNFDQVKSVLLRAATPKVLDPKTAEIYFLKIEEPILLMFPPPEPEEAQNVTDGFPDKFLLDEILQAYPNVTILLATGSKIPDTLHYVKPLNPLLVEGDDFKQFFHYSESTKYIENMR
jgi:hypothetical protein